MNKSTSDKSFSAGTEGAAEDFTSGSRKQRTPANSLFAKKWLEALRNGARTGLATSRDLHYYLGGISYPTPEGDSSKHSLTSWHKAGGALCFCTARLAKAAAAAVRIWQRTNSGHRRSA